MKSSAGQFCNGIEMNCSSNVLTSVPPLTLASNKHSTHKISSRYNINVDSFNNFSLPLRYMDEHYEGFRCKTKPYP